MKNETAYTVDQQTKEPGGPWARTTWKVTAADKDNARTAAREAAKAAGHTVGERFDRDGKSLPPAQVDKGGRVIVTLDTPADWPGASPACPDPYYWRGEINPI